MLDGYTFFRNLFGYNMDMEVDNLFHELKPGSEDSIINYERGALYDLLTDKHIKISAINQILKLHEIGYPLSMYEATNLTVEDLREIVKNNTMLRAM